MQAVFSELIVTGCTIFRSCTLRFQCLKRNAILGIGWIRRSVPESQPSF